MVKPEPNPSQTRSPVRPLVSVVGPTATGKSDFALQVADAVLQQGLHPRVVIISADSRQVYQGLEGISGADIPPDFESISNQAVPYFRKQTTFGEVAIFGVSMIRPNGDWSLAHFQQLAWPILSEAWKHGALPLVVGGTGLYQSRLFSAELHTMAGPDFELRSTLRKVSLSELQEAAQEKDMVAYKQMTIDDQHNSRRLIRLIEKASNESVSRTDSGDLVAPALTQSPTQLIRIGLTDDIGSIEQRIRARVSYRIQQGAIQEVETLLAKCENIQLPIFSATGVKEIRAFVDGQLDTQQLTDLWTLRERQYAKRQLTWWKKDKEVTWFEVGKKNWNQQAVNYVLASL